MRGASCAEHVFGHYIFSKCERSHPCEDRTYPIPKYNDSIIINDVTISDTEIFAVIITVIITNRENTIDS